MSKVSASSSESTSHTIPETMRAIVYDGKSKDAAMSFRPDHKAPVPGGSMVIIKVCAAALNPVDYKLPDIPLVGMYVNGNVVGCDVSGEVVYAPEGCGFQVGDEVFGFAKSGSLAEYTATNPELIARKPASLSHIEAAMLPVAGVTSLQSLRDIGKVTKGDNVLVIGGSGGCGSLGVQIGKALGCKVTSICSNKNIPFVKSLGADHVHAYDSPDGPVPDASSTENFDCIYDTVSSPEDMNYEPLARPLLRSDDVHSTKKPALYVAINGAVPDVIRAILSKIMPFDLQRSGYRLHFTDQKSECLQWLAHATTDGSVRVTADEFAANERLGLENLEAHVKLAFSALKSRRVKGKLVFGFSANAWDEYLKNCKK